MIKEQDKGTTFSSGGPAELDEEEKKEPSPFSLNDFDSEAEQLINDIGKQPIADPQSAPESDEPALLTRLLNRQNQLREAAEKPVVFTPPLITQNDTGIIGRNTINVIQGHYGSHKSRLAELLAALMLTTTASNDAQFLGFKKSILEQFWLCYIDTERNHSEELPYALQQIKLKAGCGIDSTPANFRFTSIKDVLRKDRMKAVEAFLTHVRSETAAHLFVVLDVVTDCVGSFNDDEQAMKLFDFIGNLCDRQNATFLLVIHQNPGSEKARGHTGTEAANKAATVIQIGYEKLPNGQDTDIIRLRYLKLRHGKRPEPLYLQYSESAKGLVMADPAAVAQFINNRKHKADADDMAERLEILLSEGPLSKNEVWTTLEAEFKAKNTTIRNRLREIIEQQPPMCDAQGRAARLADYKEGRNEFFHLVPIDES